MTHAKAERNYGGSHYQRLAMGYVKMAKENGDLPQITGDTACVDCGKGAFCYDHRDYTRPLEVVPVCRGCNAQRGHAQDAYLTKRRNEYFEKESAAVLKKPLPDPPYRGAKIGALLKDFMVKDFVVAMNAIIALLDEGKPHEAKGVAMTAMHRKGAGPLAEVAKRGESIGVRKRAKSAHSEQPEGR